ncbi:hypothetical protein [Prosthecobacter vanneervenii]|uniref:Transmembrane protein n=1 Tax=Prosthecobacter vanneervenii TaxID=48466 RepID=A0A7W7Y8C3_9BACT|nr:hypothetical protein [Prosthecobacter vanneervenii]MBB5031508.1 hypothetical protein [Prosthecobacter vanneervenii]
MARPQQEQLTPKQQVLRDLEDARASLAHHASLAAEEWSPKALLTRSVEKHRALWIGGAVIAGMALIKLVMPSASGRAGGRSENFLSGAKGSGLMALLLGPAIAFARRSVLNYGTQWFETYLRSKVSPNDSEPGAV